VLGDMLVGNVVPAEAFTHAGYVIVLPSVKKFVLASAEAAAVDQ